MELRISVVSSFLIAALFQAFTEYQYGWDPGPAPYPSPWAIPATVTTAAPFVQIAVLLMVRRYLAHVPAADRFFPRLYQQDFEQGQFAFDWERFSAVVVLGAPLLGMVYFWQEFLFDSDLSAWVRAPADGPANLMTDVWSRVEGCFLLGTWDGCRFGHRPDLDGSSFAPFWQPVFLMAGGSLGVLVLTALTMRDLAGRYDIRRKTALR